MKTNKQWYPYPEFGSYYKLDDGTLMVCPMRSDGSMNAEESGEVDFERAFDPHETAYGRILQIKEDLGSKL